jgi:hypothetical protein
MIGQDQIVAGSLLYVVPCDGLELHVFGGEPLAAHIHRLRLNFGKQSSSWVSWISSKPAE